KTESARSWASPYQWSCPHPPQYNLYNVKIRVQRGQQMVKQNLYSVKIDFYNVAMTEKIRTRRAASELRKVPKKATKKAGRAAAAPYHHGALHNALLKAAERVLEREGLAGLTLRAVAREAGVSHAAPTHHFGDLTGLVSELAAIGFRQFKEAMAGSCPPDTPYPARGLARAKAYVGYAQAHPGMYGLMFRTERLDYSRASLHEAAEASFAGLAGAIAAKRQETISG